MPKCKIFNSRKGQTLVFAMIIVLVLLVYLPTLVRLLRQDTKMTIKHKHSTTAFHLAEAAVDRGLWKLRESKDVWDSFAGTGTVAGYNDDVTYSDIEGGTYKIAISSTSEETERKIIGWGRDSSTNEKRVIEMIVKHVAVDAAVYSPELNINGNIQVHWGPIKSTTEIFLIGGIAGNYYPRKYANGQIDPRDTHYDSGDPETANSDGVEYWAWYPVKTPPAVDKQYYLENADEYYSGDHEFKNLTVSADKIYYVEGNCILKNSYLAGTLIVIGNLETSGARGEPTVNIPENARDEYDSDKCTPATDMPGYPGPPGQLTYTFGTNSVLFKGFIYVEGNWSTSGGPIINGCIQCMGNVAGGAGGSDVYYNENVAKQVETTELNIKQVSWKELAPSW